MKIRLRLALILLIIFHNTAFAQQNGSIKGKITTSDGQPAAFISIGLKEKTQNTLTDDNGAYTFHKIKPGSYILKVSAVGLNTQEKSITVSAGETAYVNFILTENNEALKEVTIAGKKTSIK